MPFDIFLDFLLDADYLSLCKKGKPDILECVKVGNELKTQFYDGCNDDISSVQSYIRLAQLNSKVALINSIIEALNEYYDKELANLLRDLGIPHKVKEGTLQKDLRIVANHAKKYSMEIELIEQKLSSNKSKPATRDMYENILAEIDPKLNAKDIDTLRFVVLFNRLKEKARRDGSRKDK